MTKTYSGEDGVIKVNKKTNLLKRIYYRICNLFKRKIK